MAHCVLSQLASAVLRATTRSKGVRRMEWTKPEFVEVKMDAEINSYQDDFSGI